MESWERQLDMTKVSVAFLEFIAARLAETGFARSPLLFLVTKHASKFEAAIPIGDLMHRVAPELAHFQDRRVLDQKLR